MSTKHSLWPNFGCHGETVLMRGQLQNNKIMFYEEILKIVYGFKICQA